MPQELNILEQRFLLKAVNFQEAYHAILEELGLDAEDFDCESQTLRHLLWTEDVINADSSGQTGDLTQLDFDSDYPANWDYIREAIAPFVESGSYIIAESQGDTFKWVWRDGKFRVIYGHMEFAPGPGQE